MSVSTSERRGGEMETRETTAVEVRRVKRRIEG
jgi:hypothetical protein